MNLDVLTLGERMVMVARIAAAEHIRQTARGEGVEIAQISMLIREARMPEPAKINPVSFNTTHTIGSGEAA